MKEKPYIYENYKNIPYDEAIDILRDHANLCGSHYDNDGEKHAYRLLSKIMELDDASKRVYSFTLSYVNQRYIEFDCAVYIPLQIMTTPFSGSNYED